MYSLFVFGAWFSAWEELLYRIAWIPLLLLVVGCALIELFGFLLGLRIVGNEISFLSFVPAYPEGTPDFLFGLTGGLIFHVRFMFITCW